MSRDVYPLKFTPIYKEKIWGGRNLERLFGRRLPGGALVGESWELADLSEGESVIAEGPAAGESLNDITRRWGRSLLGCAEALPDGRFPLLLKLLDAEDILSLQVHPDEQAVREIGPQAALKTECWYVVESRGGMIYKGVRAGVSPEQFRRAIETDTCEQVVRAVPCKAGDFHFLPAGTVHAIGAGLLIAEVQTPSDTTYRVTDWGRGREIHVERSMQCIRFDLTGEPSPGAAGETLLVTDYFTVARWSGRGMDSPRPLPMGRCAALMFLCGQAAEIRCQGAAVPVVSARAGDTVLVPAGLDGAAVAAAADCQFLVITLPEA